MRGSRVLAGVGPTFLEEDFGSPTRAESFRHTGRFLRMQVSLPDPGRCTFLDVEYTPRKKTMVIGLFHIAYGYHPPYNVETEHHWFLICWCR